MPNGDCGPAHFPLWQQVQNLEARLQTAEQTLLQEHRENQRLEQRCTELEKALARLELGDTEQAAIDALTKSIVNKILHAPVSRLRREAEREEGMAYLEVARVLFELDDESDRE